MAKKEDKKNSSSKSHHSKGSSKTASKPIGKPNSKVITKVSASKSSAGKSSNVKVIKASSALAKQPSASKSKEAPSKGSHKDSHSKHDKAKTGKGIPAVAPSKSAGKAIESHKAAPAKGKSAGPIVIYKKSEPKGDKTPISQPPKVTAKAAVNVPTKSPDQKGKKIYPKDSGPGKIQTEKAAIASSKSPSHPIEQKTTFKDKGVAKESQVKESKSAATAGAAGSAGGKKPGKSAKKTEETTDLDDGFLADDLGEDEMREYADDLKAVEELDNESDDSDAWANDLKDKADEEVILTDAEGRRYCRSRDCDQIALVDGYCRFHYLLFWKKIQIRKKILGDGKLDKYIEELTARYSDKFLEMIRRDLRTEKDFLSAIQELEIDEGAVENEFEEDAQPYIEEVRSIGESTSVDEDEY